MASSSSSQQQNQELNAFSGIEPAGNRRKVSESSRVFDVFINHRGPDVKATLASKLYNSLGDLHIRAFLDSEEKELGDSFPSTIEKAILSAKVHIAIFSKRYAESPWCLAELVLMLQSQAKIIPVFYEVKPSDLRYIENGAYADAFLKYQEKGRYLEKLNTWKEALQSISYTAGEEFNSFSDWDCQKIAEAVQKEVQRKTCLYVADYPVGLDKLVKDFERHSLDGLVKDIENKCGLKKGENEAQAVGIFGMGGVGKTTLAKELFNRYKSYYNKSSFLFDVREADVTNQLPCLQRKLLQDLFDEKDLSFRSLEEGKSYLKDHLERSPPFKSLIVVDDIDHVRQLYALLIMATLKTSDNCLVIVTTRDEGVLINAGITDRYCLEGMKRDDGRELFCWHAFDQSIPHRGYEAMVDAFMSVCGGLPLSLQVLGRHVRGRTEDYWHSELIKVSKMLHRDVKQSLRISFDSLDDEEKQVFMDVACFFLGKPTDFAEKILEGSGWNASNAIQTLRDKCLIEKDIEKDIFCYDIFCEGPEFRMHDHLRDLGREMALEHSPPHRLWRPQDLKSLESMGFKSILAETDVRCSHSIFDEAIGLKVTFFLGQSNNRFEKSGSLLWLELDGTDDFSWIGNQNLQYFPSLQQSDDQAPSQLKEKKLRELPSIPSWIPLQNLQFLKIRRGRLKSLWRNCIQAPSQLKKLHISQTSLREFPVLLGISKDSLENGGISGRDSAPVSGLEELEIDLVNGEKHVSKILISGIHYHSLKAIILCGMENLMEVNLTRVETLKHLEIRNCKKLKTVVVTSDLLNIERCNIRQCSELEMIKIEACEHSKGVTGISDLRSPEESMIEVYEELVVSNCLNSELEEFYFSSDKQLKISECPRLEKLKLGHLSCLKVIIIENCNHCVSGSPYLASLAKMEICHCSQLVLKNLTLIGMKCLRWIKFKNIKVNYFELDSCPILRTLNFDCGELVELRIRGCPNLEELPVFRGLGYLERIIIDGCGKFKYLHLDGCQNLKSVSANFENSWLDISHSLKPEELSNLATITGLEEIEIRHCDKIQNIMLPTTLIRLSVHSCRDLQRVEGTGELMELRELFILDCPKLEGLPSLSKLSCMDNIEIKHCEKLQSITLPARLIRLSVQSCRDLQTIARTGDLTEITKLIINQCPAFEVLPSLSKLSWINNI